MGKNQFMEYEQAYGDYLEHDFIKRCSLPMAFGLVEIFMSESSCERGIAYDIFVDKKEYDGGIYKDDLFQDEIGDFEYDMCVIDILRDLTNSGSGYFGKNITNLTIHK